MKALYKKELQSYLNSPVGYIVIVLFAILANFWFVKDLFVFNSASLRPFFDMVPWFMMIFIPALTMRSLSEEKRTNTLEVLLSLPVSETQIVLSKFLALLTLVGIGLLLTVSLPFSLNFITQTSQSKVSIPEFLTGYLGELFVASAFIALSLFFSSQTKNQVVAFLASVLSIFFLMILGSDLLANFIPRALLDITFMLTPIQQLASFEKGIIDLRNIYYFVSFTGLFLLLTIIQIERRP